MSNVDLSALRIDEAQSVVPKRPLGPRLFVGGVLVLALAVAATFIVPLLLPPRAVRMAGIAAVTDGVQVATASATTEAVGWVEADPFPYIVRPLVSGHIETLEVLEGARITKDETVIARLASAALQAARDRAVAAVAADHVTTVCAFTGAEAALAADAVVFVTAQAPEDGLWRALKAREAAWADHGVRSVRVIGDAEAPGPIAWATYAGHRYARELDEPAAGDEPAFRREVAALAPRGAA